jgi:hypothetical protein
MNPNSLQLITIALIVSLIWACRTLWLDLARERRRTARLRVRCEELLDELDIATAVIFEDTKRRHPAGGKRLTLVKGGE